MCYHLAIEIDRSVKPVIDYAKRSQKTMPEPPSILLLQETINSALTNYQKLPMCIVFLPSSHVRAVEIIRRISTATHARAAESVAET